MEKLFASMHLQSFKKTIYKNSNHLLMVAHYLMQRVSCIIGSTADHLLDTCLRTVKRMIEVWEDPLNKPSTISSWLFFSETFNLYAFKESWHGFFFAKHFCNVQNKNKAKTVKGAHTKFVFGRVSVILKNAALQHLIHKKTPFSWWKKVVFIFNNKPVWENIKKCM